MTHTHPLDAQSVPKPIAQALTIAGSDSGGGAGIQADLKTFHSRKVFGTSVITAITAQNTRGVYDIHPIPPDSIWQQLVAVYDDFSISSVKLGMLFDETTIALIESFFKAHPKAFGVRVLDPVMVAKGGAKLLSPSATSALKKLLPFADIITPNLPEASALTGIHLDDDKKIADGFKALKNLGANDIIIKGGHRSDGVCRDWIMLEDTVFYLDAPRLPTNNTHGTGCTFSACLCAELAKGFDKKSAIDTAKRFITNAIKHPIAVGGGIGPVNHWVSPND